MTETTYEQVTQAEDKNLDKDVEKTHAKVKEIKIFLAISRHYNFFLLASSLNIKEDERAERWGHDGS